MLYVRSRAFRSIFDGSYEQSRFGDSEKQRSYGILYTLRLRGMRKILGQQTGDVVGENEEADNRWWR